jgi:hypothetical protein
MEQQQALFHPTMSDFWCGSVQRACSVDGGVSAKSDKRLVEF